MVRLHLLISILGNAASNSLPLCSLAADISTETLEALKTALSEAGFAPYVTAVGGSGVGILHPEHRTGASLTDLAQEILSTGVDALDSWALSQGRWGFA